MKKWIIIGCVVIVLVVAILFGLASNIGPIVKKAVNTYGPEITKTAIKLEDVKVSIFSGEAKLSDFFLGNPKGFTAPSAMEVGKISVDIDETSLTGDTIIIDKIEVIAPNITYEKKSGTDNFAAILNNVKKSAGASQKQSTKTAEKKEKSDKKIIIRNFIVKDGKVNLVMSALGNRSITAPLPDIHLKNIGESKKGASPAEAFKEIFSALHGKITSNVVTDVLNKGLKDLGIGLQDLGKSAGKEVGKATEKLKGLFGK